MSANLTLDRISQLQNAYSSTIREVTEEEKDAYIEATRRVLQWHGLTSSEMNRVDLKFNVSQGIAYYETESGAAVVIDLLSIEDEDVNDAINALIQTAGAEEKIQSAKRSYRAHSKGSPLSREIPLMRTTEALRGLPNGFDYAHESLMPKLLREKTTREDRVQVAKRLHFVEFMRRRMLMDLSGRLAQKNQDLTNLIQTQPDHHKEIEALRREITKLTGIRDELEQIDYYALARLIAAYPVDESKPSILSREKIKSILQSKYNELDGLYRTELQQSQPCEKRIQELRKEVQHFRSLIQNVHKLGVYELTQSLTDYTLDDLWLKELAPMRQLVQDVSGDIRGNISKNKGKLQKVKEFFVSSKQDLEKDEISYIKDLVGGLYIHRWDYHAYCEQQGLKMKREGAMDILLREGIAFAASEDGTLSKSMLQEFFQEGFFSYMSKLASIQIGEPEEDWYHMSPSASGLPDKAQKQLDEQREEELKEHLKAHFDRIDWTATLPEPEPEPSIFQRFRNALPGLGRYNPYD